MADINDPALTDCPPGSVWSKTAGRCVRTSYGVNAGDQAAQSAAEFEAAAKREAARMTARGKEKAAELRDQAARMRGQ